MVAIGRVSSVLNAKILDWSKFKAFAEDKINVGKKLKNGHGGRKHCGKRRKCWLPAFSPFPTMFFRRFLFYGCEKSGLCGKELIRR